MKKLRGFAFLFGLLVVGVLMAPSPSEALPTVNIDGVDATLASRSCDTGYHACYTIPTGTYNNWTVGNVSGSNTARIMIEDNDGAGTATDKMRMRGITFQRTAGTASLVIITSNTYDAFSDAANDFQFALTSGGYFVPLPVSMVSGVGTTKNDQVKLSGVVQLSTTACVSPYTGVGCTALPGAKDTTAFQTDVDDHGNTSWTFSQTASSVGNCDTTGTGRCAPFIREKMTVNVGDGNDTLFLDGDFSNHATCRPDSPPASVPPGPPDQTPVGPVCKAVQNKMQQENDKVLREELRSFDAALATPFIPCLDCE